MQAIAAAMRMTQDAVGRCEQDEVEGHARGCVTHLPFHILEQVQASVQAHASNIFAIVKRHKEVSNEEITVLFDSFVTSPDSNSPPPSLPPLAPPAPSRRGRRVGK